MAILSWQSFPGNPFLAILSWQSFLGKIRSARRVGYLKSIPRSARITRHSHACGWWACLERHRFAASIAIGGDFGPNGLAQMAWPNDLAEVIWAK